jgi:hypothetical protein
MNIIYFKQISSILSSYDIIKYLNIKDTAELSSTNKLMYVKFTCYRFERYNLDNSKFQGYISNTQPEIYWTNGKYKPKPEYYNDIINKYKPYLINLTFEMPDYTLLTHFKLQNIAYLQLYSIILPKLELLNIFEYFKKLNDLTLAGIRAAYSKTESIRAKLIFPAYLRHLNCENY